MDRQEDVLNRYWGAKESRNDLQLIKWWNLRDPNPKNTLGNFIQIKFYQLTNILGFRYSTWSGLLSVSGYYISISRWILSCGSCHSPRHNFVRACQCPCGRLCVCSLLLFTLHLNLSLALCSVVSVLLAIHRFFVRSNTRNSTSHSFLIHPFKVVCNPLDTMSLLCMAGELVGELCSYDGVATDGLTRL